MARGNVEILAPGEMPAESAEEAFERLDRLATLLDSALVIPGTNIRFGLSRFALWRMMGNVAIDGLVGAVPLLGDAFDVAFRANRRNVRILRNQLAKRRR
jgi:hypothetical protein